MRLKKRERVKYKRQIISKDKIKMDEEIIETINADEEEQSLFSYFGLITGEFLINISRL